MSLNNIKIKSKCSKGLSYLNGCFALSVGQELSSRLNVNTLWAICGNTTVAYAEYNGHGNVVVLVGSKINFKNQPFQSDSKRVGIEYHS